MKKRLWSGPASVVLIIVLGVLLAGCGNFRQQALEAQTRLDEAVQRAEIAEEAAARNAALILEMDHRIEDLEEALTGLQDLIDSTATDD